MSILFCLPYRWCMQVATPVRMQTSYSHSTVHISRIVDLDSLASVLHEQDKSAETVILVSVQSSLNMASSA